MEYFSDGSWSESGDGCCADLNCTCGRSAIDRGDGYLYLSEEVVDFRYQFRTHEEAAAETERLVREKFGRPVHYESRFGPQLLCESAATRKKIDLDLAHADAEHWWSTGQAPLRSSPIAGSQQAKIERLERLDIPG